jgi:enamine deaminase RidA (YjgF/YER057c/UK114 family)
VWLPDIREKDQMDAAWKAWVDPENKPVRACVEARLATPDTRVEIMVTAAK